MRNFLKKRKEKDPAPPRETPAQEKTWDIKEGSDILIREVLRVVREMAGEKLPQTGLFRKFGVGLSLPEDEAFSGLLSIECGTEPQKRSAQAGMYRNGTDRLVSNWFFFDSTDALLEWLEAEQTVAELLETYYRLRHRAANR